MTILQNLFELSNLKIFNFSFFPTALCKNFRTQIDGQHCRNITFDWKQPLPSFGKFSNIWQKTLYLTNRGKRYPYDSARFYFQGNESQVETLNPIYDSVSTLQPLSVFL